METTIDSLVINIESSSSNASSAIDKLTDSLNRLKKIGATSKAVKSLTDLSSALNSFSGSSELAHNLDTISTAINKLNDVKVSSTIAKNLSEIGNAATSFNGIDSSAIGKLGELSQVLNTLTNTKISSTIGKSIESTADGLIKLASADVNSVIEKDWEGLANSMEKLNGVKGDGISKLMNGLSRLNTVNAQLTDENIQKFGEGVERLMTKLDPLAERLNNVKAGIEAVNGSLKKATFGQERGNKITTKTIFSFNELGEAVKNVKSTLSNIGHMFAKAAEPATDFDGIANRFVSTFGDTAEETYNWIVRLEKELGINSQEFMSMASLYNAQLRGMGVSAKFASKMALGYSELSYDIWARYNDQFKSLEQVQNKMQSMIAGFSRTGYSLGTDISTTGLESTVDNIDSILDRIDMSNKKLEDAARSMGITKTVQQMSQAEKQVLRYVTVVNAMTENGTIGTYSAELQTAEGALRRLSLGMKGLAQTIGKALLPVLQAVLPYLQAIVEIANEFVIAVANFFHLEMPTIDFSKTSGGIGDVADSFDDATASAKKFKQQTVGIDELNVISPPTGGNSGSGGFDLSGFDLDSVWDDSVFKNLNDKVEELKTKLKSILPVLLAVGATFAAIGAIGSFVKLTTEITGLGEALGGLTKLQTIGFVAGLAGAFLALFEGVYMFRYGIDWEHLTAYVVGIGVAFMSFLGAGSPLFAGLTAFIGGLGLLYLGVKDLIENGWTDKNTAAIMTAVTLIGTAIAFVAKNPIVLLMTAVLTLAVFIASHWDEIKEKTNELKLKVSTAFDNIQRSAKALVDFVGGTIVTKWRIGIDALRTIVQNFSLRVMGFFENVVNGAVDMINTVLEVAHKLGKLENIGLLNHVQWTATLESKYSSQDIRTRANGGYVDNGQLFIAREAGAELVGNIGGRTAVANNEQIVDAVSNGVYMAVMSAMSNSSNDGNQNFNIFIDGRQVAAAVERAQKERGSSLFGSEVYSTY